MGANLNCTPQILLDPADSECNPVPDGSQLGQYASVSRDSDGTLRLVRDPIGIGKLFYVREAGGTIRTSCNFVSLLGGGSRVFAAAKGATTIVESEGKGGCLRSSLLAPDAEHTSDADFATRATERLHAAFGTIREFEDDGWKIFVALSGGLDSSAIAWFAQNHLRRPIACTLDLGRTEDADKAARTARTIGIRHEVFTTSREEILENVAIAPRICQDYRDFNVHCAVINLILGQRIRSRADSETAGYEKVMVLTGDLMNEFTNDYSEEVVDGTVYYRLPRIKGRQLQRHLVGGLDTSDRELSPFAYHGVACIQPYSILVDLYLNLDASRLAVPDAKRSLNSFMVPSEVLNHLPQSKLRAQVGDKETMGVLGICHREGIGERFFLDRLLAGTGATREQIPIVMGRYEVEHFESAS